MTLDANIGGAAANIKPLRIVGYFHLFPGEHNAGSETTVHAALRAMVNRGHEVRVICDRSLTAPYDIDGIKVVRPPRRGQQSWLEEFVADADLIVTHLDLTSQAMGLATNTKKPLAHFVHNSAQLKYWHVKERKCELAIFNSHWVAEAEQWEGQQLTIHPVVEPDHYRCERGKKITLVNPTPGKGVNTFKALARQMPDRQFLAVEGGYGEQVITESYENVEWMAHTPDIRHVFRKTKVLLMPSDYESYGRVGIEAACAGIPTIAHPTPGLTEAFGEAGIFCDRNDISAWYVEVDRLLTDEVYYRKRSASVLALADSLDPESEFDRLEESLIQTVQHWQHREDDKAMRMWTTDRRLYYDKDRRITTDKNQAVTLCCGIGGRIPEDEAIRLGFIPVPTHQVERGIDTKALSHPEENKAIASPEENKAAEEKKTRKKKVA